MCGRTSTPRSCAQPQHLPRHAGRIGDAVAPAAGRADDVAGRETGHDGRVDALDRHAEVVLEGAPFLELGEAGVGRREEEIADLAEERRTERREELDALAREHDLGRRRELLPDASHRARRRAADELTALCDDDVVGAEERELVRDARAHRARACDDYASHSRTMRATSSRSSSVSAAEWLPHAAAHRDAAEAEHHLRRRVERKRLQGGAKRADPFAVLRRRLAYERDDRVREARREAGHRARRAGRERLAG